MRATSLQLQTATAGYSSRALEAIVAVGQADDPPQLLDQLMMATAAIGATASVYWAAIPESGAEPSCFSLFACHPCFAPTRATHRPHLLDHPWFRYAQAHCVPGTDRDVPLTRAGDEQAMEDARHCGFKAALIVPVPAAAGRGWVEMLCLGSEHPDAFEGAHGRVVRTLARSLATELHDWLSTYLCRKLCESARLGPSDLLMLTLQAQGLGTKEISARTGMTMPSVDSRFQRLNRRMNCATRQASARRAAAYGLLQPWLHD